MPFSSSLVNGFQFSGSSKSSGLLLEDPEETKRMDETVVEWLQNGQFENIIVSLLSKHSLSRARSMVMADLSSRQALSKAQWRVPTREDWTNSPQHGHAIRRRA
jgi:hypothetical protein